MPTAVPRTKMCFACGAANPMGMGLEPVLDDDGVVRCRFTPRPEYRGYKGLMHGGLAGVVFDELVGAAVAMHIKGLAATLKLEIEYKRPVRMDRETLVECRYLGGEGEVERAEGVMLDPEGNVLATCKGAYIRMTPERMAKMKGT